MGDRSNVSAAAWYPDERAHAGPEHLERGYVAGYDAKTQLDLAAALALLRGELEAHVRDEHSTFTWLLEPLLTHAGFEILDRHVGTRIYATYVCRRT